MRRDLNHSHKIKSTKGCLAFKKFFLENSIKNDDKFNKILIIIDYWFVKLENFYKDEGVIGLEYLNNYLKGKNYLNISDALNSFYNKDFRNKLPVRNNKLYIK